MSTYYVTSSTTGTAALCSTSDTTGHLKRLGRGAKWVAGQWSEIGLGAYVSESTATEPPPSGAGAIIPRSLRTAVGAGSWTATLHLTGPTSGLKVSDIKVRVYVRTGASYTHVGTLVHNGSVTIPSAGVTVGFAGTLGAATLGASSVLYFDLVARLTAALAHTVWVTEGAAYAPITVPGVPGAALGASGQLSATGSVRQDGSATLASAGALTPSGVTVLTGAGALAGSASLTATGYVRTAPGVTLAASATLSATGVVSQSGAASLGAAAIVATTGDVRQYGAAALGSTGSVAATGTVVEPAAVKLVATGSLEATGSIHQTGSAVIAASGTLTATGIAVPQAFVFLTPYPRTVPTFLADSSALEVRFWGHYNVERAAVNVFLRNDGTYCQTYPSPTPTDMTVATPPATWEPSAALQTANVPYPWNPTLPTDPYVHIQNWTGSTTTVTLTPRIKKVYWGGHVNLITVKEHDSLVAAGYGYCIRNATATEIPAGWTPT